MMFCIVQSSRPVTSHKVIEDTTVAKKWAALTGCCSCVSGDTVQALTLRPTEIACLGLVSAQEHHIEASP